MVMLSAELETLLQHFGEEKKGTVPFVKNDACREEWMLMKQVVSKNYCKCVLFWNFCTPNIEKPSLIFSNMCLSIPVTSADFERGFGTQNRIKQAHRSSHGAKWLEVLMRISLQGRKLACVPPKCASIADDCCSAPTSCSADCARCCCWATYAWTSISVQH